MASFLNEFSGHIDMWQKQTCLHLEKKKKVLQPAGDGIDFETVLANSDNGQALFPFFHVSIHPHSTELIPSPPHLTGKKSTVQRGGGTCPCLLSCCEGTRLRTGGGGGSLCPECPVSSSAPAPREADILSNCFVLPRIIKRIETYQPCGNGCREGSQDRER